MGGSTLQPRAPFEESLVTPSVGSSRAPRGLDARKRFRRRLPVTKGIARVCTSLLILSNVLPRRLFHLYSQARGFGHCGTSDVVGMIPAVHARNRSGCRSLGR